MDQGQIPQGRGPPAHALQVVQPGLQAQQHDDSSSNSSRLRPKRPWWTPGALISSYLIWAIPGLGMFSEAYIVFSVGLIGSLQQVIAPNCFGRKNPAVPIDPGVCDPNLVKHVASYIQICGIIAGMLLWGILGDFTGRKWGSRCVSAIMLSGVILLIFSPFAPTQHGYFTYFLVAQTWYGFGVGGEYPMASSSAAEMSATTPELRKHRGRQVALVFSNQGMGNFVNACVLAICMAIFGQTGPENTLTLHGARATLALMYAVGGFVALLMVLYRFLILQESKLFEEVANIDQAMTADAAADNKAGFRMGVRKYIYSTYYFWPRQLVASAAWIANDFAFYGNKLQQGLFIGFLYPGATPFKQLQWTILNNFIALLGYYCAAWLMDYSWYGRRRMQIVGFTMMFVFYIIIYGQWDHMGAKTATRAGVHAFQAMYYLSSFFNQFGPNATTWLVAGEIFPTDVRTTNHGFAAAMGKVGAIIAAVWISYISDSSKVFLISAIWGIGGAVVTWIWLPDTTGLELEEYDRMHRYMAEGRFDQYHGEAINPRFLSPWERFVSRWSKNYNPELDRKQFAMEAKKFQFVPGGREEMSRMHVIPHGEYNQIVHHPAGPPMTHNGVATAPGHQLVPGNGHNNV